MESELIHIAIAQTAQRWADAYSMRNKHYNVIENDDDKLVIVAQEFMVFTFTREELEKILNDQKD